MSHPPPLSIRANMLWNSSGSLIYLGSQWLITILVVRLAAGTYQDAGVLALGMTIMNIFAPLAEYRMSIYQVSDVKEENSVGEYLAFRIMTSSVALVAIIIYSFLTAPRNALVAIYLYCLTKILSQVIGVLHSQDQVHRRMDFIGRSLILQGLGTLGAFAAVFGATKNIALACGAMAVTTAAVGFFYDLPRTRRFGPIRPHIRWAKAGKILVSYSPVVAAALALAAAPAVPRQFLAAAQGEAALGIYTSVAAPAAIIQMGATYIYSPLMTYFARSQAAGEADALRRLFARTVGGITLGSAAGATGLLVLGPWLLDLMYGPTIAPHTYLIGPIIAFTWVSAYVWFFSSLLIALRGLTGNVVGNFTSFAVVLPATWIFIPEWGMNGVSFAGIASYSVAGVVMMVFLLRLFRSKTTPTMKP